MDNLWSFWSLFVIIMTLGFMVAVWWLIEAAKKVNAQQPANELLDHEFDGIREYNNPLPKWWLWMFYGTLVFGFGYFIFFPLGGWQGVLNWTSVGQLEKEQQAHEQRFMDTFDTYARLSVEELLNDSTALAIGQRIYAQNCALCHNNAGTGGYGFPNLTNNDWLYGGSPEQIVQTLTHGRQGVMPGFSSQLGEIGIAQVSNYVLTLSGHEARNPDQVAEGQVLYQAVCAACHGDEGKGNQALGAPNLTNDIWLYANPEVSLYDNIRVTLRHGRMGVMPAFDELLGAGRINLVAAYVYNLRQEDPQ